MVDTADPSNIYAALFTGGMLVFMIILITALIVVKVFYCLSLYKAMNRIPEEKRAFPAWFVWMFLVPFAGIVFEWIMEPFGIPNSFKAALAGNSQAHKDAKTLQGIGIALVICLTASVIPVVGVIAGIGGFVLWIIYWVKVVKFKRTYLDKVHDAIE